MNNGREKQSYHFHHLSHPFQITWCERIIATPKKKAHEMIAAGFSKFIKRAKFLQAVIISVPDWILSLDTDGELRFNVRWGTFVFIISDMLHPMKCPRKICMIFVTRVQSRFHWEVWHTIASSGKLSWEMTRIFPPSRRIWRALDRKCISSVACGSNKAHMIYGG